MRKYFMIAMDYEENEKEVYNSSEIEYVIKSNMQLFEESGLIKMSEIPVAVEEFTERQLRIVVQELEN